MSLITFENMVPPETAFPMSYDYHDATVSGSTTRYQYYTVSGSGFVIVTACVRSDTTNSYGSSYGTIGLKKSEESSYTTLVYNYNRVPSSLAQRQGMSNTIGIQVDDGDVIRMQITTTKSGSKLFMYNCLCFGCTVTYS